MSVKIKMIAGVIYFLGKLFLKVDNFHEPVLCIKQSWCEVLLNMYNYMSGGICC